MESTPIQTGPAPWACKNMTVRMRRETPIADTNNSRGYERWRSSVPQPIEGLVGRPDVHDTAPFMDMKPQQSRSDVRNWIQTPTYVSDPSIPLQKNPYFSQYDIGSDPRNVGRELRGTVSEPLTTRGAVQNRGLLERSMESRYLPENEMDVPIQKMLQSFDNLRPTLNDMKATFR